MDQENHIQKELFSISGSAKNAKRRNLKRFSLNKKQTISKRHLTVTITYENIVFYAVVVIMASILLFALGVERGKNIYRKNILSQTSTSEPKEITKEETSEAKIDKNIVKPKKEESGLKKKEEEQPKAEPAGQAKYTLQLIAYKSEVYAKQEMAELEKIGYKPFLVIEKNFYQICVGKFRNKAEAEPVIKSLKKLYKDCYLRKLN